MIALIDYGAGNLRSVANALDRLELPHRICGNPDDLAGTTRIILPGVGHFGAATEQLDRTGMSAALQARARNGVPFLGICLGLHLLFERSEEAPDRDGLSLLPGTVVRLPIRRVPHMGWNRVRPDRPGGLIPEGSSDYFYFAHSYSAIPGRSSDQLGSVHVEDLDVAAIVGRDRLFGVQFHPEKSGPAGQELLRRFATC